MKNSRLALSAIVLLALSTAGAQNPAPATASTSTLHADVRLVVFDATVIDGQGRAVSGLKVEDFKLREDGSEQTLKSLEDHTGTGPLATVTPSPAFISAPLPPGTYGNRPRPQNNVWNVIVFDMLNTSIQDEARARAQVRQFAKAMPAGVSLALVRMSAAPATVLVPFSAGAPAIDTLLAGKGLSPLSSPLRDVYNSDDDAYLRGIYQKMADAAHISPEQMFQSARETETDRLDMKVELTLQSLDSLAAWLEQYPGKKNLFWLSEGFPLTAQPQSFRDLDHPGRLTAWTRSYVELQKETDKRLESARVAVFPIDIRGVAGASREGIDSIDIHGTRYVGSDAGQRLNEDIEQFDARVNEENAGMYEIADATGGIPTLKRNDLAQVMAERLHQGQTFYTLTYSPNNAKWDGHYRKIELKVTRPGCKLYYRRGYFAVDRGKSVPDVPDAFSIAMRRGAPDAGSLLFTARLDRTVSGHVGLQYMIDAHQLAFAPTEDDRQMATLNCAVAEYDDAGKLLGSSEISVSGRVHPDQMERLEAAGFPAHQDVPLMPGAKWLVVGVMDHTAGRFGTLQIPLNAQ